jgi:hypothetical protein
VWMSTWAKSAKMRQSWTSFIGVGEIRASNIAAKAHVIKLAFHRT